MARLFSERLSAESNAIASRARRIATRHRHPCIDHAHFLLAFLEVPNGAIRAIASKHSAGLQPIRQRAIEFLTEMPKQSPAATRPRPLSHRMEAILELAHREASRRGARLVSPRDLLLALAAEDLFSEAERGSVSARLLAPLNLTPHQIRRILFPAAN